METILIRSISKSFASYGSYRIKVTLPDGTEYVSRLNNMRVIDEWEDQEVQLDAASIVLLKHGINHDNVKFDS